MTTAKKKIQAIYPLSFMQRTLLFHHLQEERDQGFLSVRCDLIGPLDGPVLQTALDQTIKRHEILRSSVHWEEMKTPVQAVHHAAHHEIEFLDWSDYDPSVQQSELQALKEANVKSNLQLTQAPVSRFQVIKLEVDRHVLLWSCHHILIDGWSTAILLEDLFNTYGNLLENAAPDLPALPSYQTYLQWKKKQDITDAERYWKGVFRDNSRPTLMNTGKRPVDLTKLETRQFEISAELTEALKAYCREHRLTLNTVLQGIYGLLIGQYLRTDDVILGTTVSGRPPEFIHIDRMTGLFMNVLPLRMQFDDGATFTANLQKFQQLQTESRNYEYLSQDQIASWVDQIDAQLFDVLLVFENFPWDAINAGGLTVDNFRGGLTTTYPMTCVVRPGTELHCDVIYDAQIIDAPFLDWMVWAFTDSLTTIVTNPETSLTQLKTGDEAPKQAVTEQGINGLGEEHIKSVLDGREIGYEAPQNAIELQLTKLWEQVLGRQPIGVTENFFEIGGRSVQAVRLFALIEKQTGQNLPPVTILKHPNIRALAAAIEKGQTQSGWSSLVPFRASGSRIPLVCVHAGGGHVFFYNDLTRYLGADQPVYSLQPKGLDGVEAGHDSIEEMAAHYVEELRSAVPHGPYALLTICYGNAVCVEMARLLKDAGEEIALLAIIDSAPSAMESIAKPSVQTSVNRYVELLKHGDFKGLMARIPVVWAGVMKRWTYLRATTQERNLKKMQQRIHVLDRNHAWRPYDGKVTLIRSTEIANSPDRDFHIPRWQEIAAGGVDVYVIEGKHHHLFEEPYVGNLAAQLKVCLDREQIPGADKNLLQVEG